MATVLFNTKKANWLILPGILLSMTGILRVLGGEEGFNVAGMLHNVQINPLSYGLAFLGALLWSAYCVVTIRLAKDVNGIALFFMIVAAVLWIKYFITGDTVAMQFSFAAIVYLILAACAMGFGYAAWNVGILHGNVTVLAGASYFIPVLSSGLSSVLLTTVLGFYFWQGAVLVCAGSVLCWLSTRPSPKRTQTTG